MNNKLGFLREQIEEMRRIKLQDSKKRIGEVAKTSAQAPWAENSAEVLLNTVLAMRRRWEETAKPRLEAFRRNYPGVKIIYDLKKLMDSMSEKEFCSKIFGMRIKCGRNWRYKMLRDMLMTFIRYQKEGGFTSDYAAMRDWTLRCDISNLEKDMIGALPIVGLATVQNMRICLGIDTVERDVHIKSVLRKLKLGNDVEVCEVISGLTGYSCIELDQIFWLYDRNCSKEKK
jgi:hypothetical protein